MATTDLVGPASTLPPTKKAKTNDSDDGRTLYDFLYVLTELSNLYEKHGDGRRAKSFSIARESLAKYEEAAVFESSKEYFRYLSRTNTKGVGRSTLELLDEFINTGTCAMLEELRDLPSQERVCSSCKRCRKASDFALKKSENILHLKFFQTCKYCLSLRQLKRKYRSSAPTKCFLPAVVSLDKREELREKQVVPLKKPNGITRDELRDYAYGFLAGQNEEKHLDDLIQLYREERIPSSWKGFERGSENISIQGNYFGRRTWATSGPPLFACLEWGQKRTAEAIKCACLPAMRTKKVQGLPVTVNTGDTYAPETPPTCCTVINPRNPDANDVLHCA